MRRWKFWLSLVVPVLTLAWLFTMHGQGGQKAFSSGPLSRSHAAFTQQCALCHLRQAGYFQSVADKACLSCHDAPAHHANQTFTPPCSACHLEHKGSLRLAATADSACTQCHANLQSRDASLSLIRSIHARSIHGFDGDHPEFAGLSEGATDPGGIRLNHSLHMQTLLAPSHTRVQLACENCHRSGADKGDWPYAGSQLRTVNTTPMNLAGRSSRATSLMAPPRFVENCAGCHRRLPD